MAVFKIKKDTVKGIESHIRSTWRFFLKNPRTKEDVKIVIGKEFITVHIKAYYCIICNDLTYLYKINKLIASKRSLNWLQKYIY